MQEKSPQGRLAPHTRFGRYSIVREIGSGGMGFVYEAVFNDLNKRVALKILASEYAKVEEHRRRFVREAQAAARIRHLNVVEVFDVGTHDGVPFLAMDFLRGEDLRSAFDRGAMPARELVDIIMPVLSALVTAHETGVIHRDLKPENIFLSVEPNRSPRPMVLDFGISKVMDDAASHKLTAGASMVGTPLYMSPEQARGDDDIDERTDQYALGVLLYEGLAGRAPFESDSIYGLLVCKMEGNAPLLKELRPELPEDLCAAIERAMDPDRDARFASVRALAQALLPFASKHGALSFAMVVGNIPAEQPSALRVSGNIPAEQPAALRVGGNIPAEQPSALRVSGNIPAEQPSALRVSGNTPAEQPAVRRASSPEPTPIPPQRNSTLRTSAREVTVTARPGRSPRRELVVIAGALLLLLVGGVVALRTQDAPKTKAVPAVYVSQPQHIVEPAPLPAGPAPVQAFTVLLNPMPDTATVTLDGEPLGTGYVVRTLPRDGRSHTVVVSAEGYRSRELHFTDAAPLSDVVLELIPAVTTPPPAPARIAWVARRKAPQREPVMKRAPAEGGGEATPRTTSNGAPIVY